MDEPGDDVLADAALTSDQNLRLACRDATGDAQHARQCWTRADDGRHQWIIGLPPLLNELHNVVRLRCLSVSVHRRSVAGAWRLGSADSGRPHTET